MQNYPCEAIRNIGIVGHNGVGKTTLVESMLFKSGAIKRPGRVEDGNTVSDFQPEEIARRITVSATLVPVEWNGKKLNILDTPGYSDFLGEIEGTMRAVDGALFVVCAASGVQVQTEVIWEKAEDAGLPKMVFINKMNRENADFFKTFNQLKSFFPNGRFVACQLPIGQADDYKGYYDLLTGEIVMNDGSTGEITPDLEELIATYLDQLTEIAVEGDDDLLAKYLEGEPTTPDEVVRGLAAGFRAGTAIPVVLGSAASGSGINRLMELLGDFFPEPGCTAGENDELKAFVFKSVVDPYVGKINLIKILKGTLKAEMTLYNLNKGEPEKITHLFTMCGKAQNQLTKGVQGDILALTKLVHTNTGDTLSINPEAELLPPLTFAQATYALALVPKTKNDDDKLGTAVFKLLEDDPSLQVVRNVETHQLLLKGMGEAHIDINIEKLKRKYGVQVDTQPPKVPYRETIRKQVEVEGKHKKQTGGHGQFGHVWLRLGPSDKADLVFSEEIFGGAVPKTYIPAVEKGLRETMQEGILAGFPVTGVKAVLYDGSYHNVDSSEMAFKMAAALAFRKGAQMAQPVLLEPVMKVAITVPEPMMGDIISDLNGKRGKVIGMEPQGKREVINAFVPMAEMLNYSITLRSLTQGRGSFNMEFARYDDVPPKMAEQIINSTKGTKEKEEKH